MAREFGLSVRGLRHIDDWVFDLDNTLYPARHNLFTQIDARMTHFIQTRFNLDKDAAYALQKKYLHDYGTTLFGLMSEHKMQPHDYLEFVHDIDVSVLPPDPALRDAIAALAGRKFIFTNSTNAHAAQVINRLGLSDLFDGVFDIVDADYVPKPKPTIYPLMLARFGLDPKRTAYFEDIEKNLAPAHELGMTTIWVNETNSETAAPFVHHHTPNLKGFLKNLAT